MRSFMFLIVTVAVLALAIPLNTVVKHRTQLCSRRFSFANPSNDAAFKHIFKDNKNKKLLLSFLNDVLMRREDSQIKEIEYLDTETTFSSISLKSSRFDVLCTDVNGGRYIIQMEKDISKSGTNEGFLKRIQLYLSRLHSSQLRKGNEYSSIKPAVCIVITGSKPLPTSSHISRHEIVDIKQHSKSLNDLEWIIIELPKFVMPTMPSELDEWLYLFKEGYKKESIPPFIQSDIVRCAYEALDQKRWSQELEYEYLLYDMALMDYQNDLAESKTEGKYEAVKEIVITMLGKGIPETTIIKLTNITRDDLESIIKQNNELKDSES
mmetsp:Transcript_24917/g.35792  ORF Transcript_24917/g.35792 Transcript_24917/m.35792 type:complete len:323 (+) Transcript_24917:101-1069(+)